MKDTKALVRRYIEEDILMGGGTAFADGDSLIEHRVVDSTGFLELIAYLEDEFGLTVEDDEMVPENLGSLDRIETYVRRKLAA
ncbi:MAG: acyl carrier protein [Burkholderiaceae bacterium]